VDLLSALVTLWRERAGDSLRFSRPGATAGFDLVGGEVVATLSSQAPFDTTAILIRAGKVDAAAVGRLAIPEGGDATVAAMQAGLITDRDRKWAQKIRAIEVLSDLLGWLEGEYVREPAVPAPPGDWTLPLPRLVLELFLRSRDRTLVEHALGAPDLPLVKAGGFDEEFETYGLTSDAGDVVALIDGRASAEEIAESSNADEFAVLKLLAALTTLGLVHPEEAAPAADPRRLPAAAREPEREPVAPPVEPMERVETERWEVEEESPESLPAEPEPEPPEAPPEDIAPEPVPLPIDEEHRPPEPEREPAQPIFHPVPAPDPMLAVEAPSPADFFSRPERGIEAVDPVVDLTGGDGSPPDPPRRRSPALLLGLLAALIVAVVLLLLARSREGSREQTATANVVSPTALENPAFPPAETAVALPTRTSRTLVRTAAASPPPVATEKAPLTAAAPPTRVFTRVPPTPPPTAIPTRPRPTSVPTAIPTRLPPTKPPTAVPTRAAPTKPPTAAATRPAPTRAPTAAPTRIASPAPPPTAVASSRGERTREDWIARAERDKRDLAKRRGVRYAVQLELACEVETLQKAWNWDRPPGTIWLLPTSFHGRACFRVLWGRYGSLAQARAARTRVPEFFAAPGNRPTIVSVR
jgi:septal ring-binding cell division protein DamX